MIDKGIQVLCAPQSNMWVLLAPYAVAILSFLASIMILKIAQASENKRFLDRENNETQRLLINKDLELVKFKTQLNFEVKHKLYSELLFHLGRYESLMVEVVTFCDLLLKEHSTDEENCYFTRSYEAFNNRIPILDKINELSHTSSLFFPLNILNLIGDYNNKRNEVDNLTFALYKLYKKDNDTNMKENVELFMNEFMKLSPLRVAIIMELKKDLGIA